MSYYAWKMRAPRSQCFSPQMNNWHPWQLKKSKSWGPFWSYLLNSTANTAHLPTLQSLTGKYRFFTGKSLCSNSILTCFGSVQGLKGQISLKYREIYAFCTGISILYLHLCLCFYNRDFPAFWKTTTWNFAKTGKTL